MDENGRLLVVDDDDSIRDALAEYLTAHGFAVRTAVNGCEMDRLLSQEAFDLLVLDVMLPGEDGLAICRRVGGEGLPILMLSALGSTVDRVVGLETGAADYLPKPFEARELLARIRAILRRPVAGWPADGAGVLHFAGWRFDFSERSLSSPAGRAVSLSEGDCQLLRAFTRAPERLLSRDQLLDLARGQDVTSFDRAVDLAVSRLRRKLAEHDEIPLIDTVRGAGYRFRVPVRRQ